MRTSAISRLNGAFSIWSRSWTGTVARYWPGGPPTAWTSAFVWRLWKRPWTGLAGPKSSIPTKGSQFTGFEWTSRLRAAGVKISMDGKGRWLDNVFIERLWRSLKYECVYLHALTGGREARRLIGSWIAYYNTERPHSSLDGQTPDRIYNACPGLAPDMRTAA